jgi:pumilio RNA-binding family
VLEHGAEQDRARALSLIVTSLHLYGTDAQALKSIDKAIKCGGSEVLDKLVNRLCEPGTGKRRAMLVDLALNAAGSQLITLILPLVNKDQGTTLYDAVSPYTFTNTPNGRGLTRKSQIKKHVVTLKGSKSGSRVTWLLYALGPYPRAFSLILSP